jgi:hypothetical protein
MAALLTAIVLVFTVCHSLKAAINIYEAKQVGRELRLIVNICEGETRRELTAVIKISEAKQVGTSLPSSTSTRPIQGGRSWLSSTSPRPNGGGGAQSRH